MAFVIKDRVFEYTTTTGTGTLTLGGTKSGYQQFATVGDGNTTYYTIVAENGDWESGIGTYTSSGTTLARTTVLASSNSNNLVNFATGTKEVFSSQPAGRAVAADTLATSTSLGTSNLLAPSQNAVKDYVDAQVEKAAFKNRIINGDFLIDDYNSGAETIANVSKYTINRWKAGITQANKITTQRITSGAMPRDTRSYLRVKIASAIASPVSVDYFGMLQYIEGINLYDFNFGTADASPVTLSFKVRCSVAGTYSISLVNGANNRSYVTTYTINLANTWEDKSITIPGDVAGTWDKSTGVGCTVSFTLGVGSNYITSTTDTWLSGLIYMVSGSTQLISNLNATFDITNVQLEKGSVATSYEVIDIVTQRMRCERYYQICFANTRGYSPGAGNIIETVVQTRCVMRATPTASINAGTRGNVSAVSVDTPTIYGARHVITSSAVGSTYAIAEGAVFNAEL